MDRLEFDEGLDAFCKPIQAANRYVEEKKPWVLAKAEDPTPLDDVLRVLLEVLRLSSVLSVPFMPAKSAEMRTQLGLRADISVLKMDEARRPGDPNWREVGKPAPLFPKIETK